MKVQRPNIDDLTSFEKNKESKEKKGGK